MTALKGVIFGLGGIARQSHLPGFRTLAGDNTRLEIVGAVDPAFAGGTVDGVPVVRSRADLARLGPLDFIDVCTPTSTHLDLVLWGLDQGYHIICEKPVALSPAEANLITRRASEAGRVVLPCHQHRHNPAWVQLRRWVDEGAIGRWHLAEFSVHRPGADPGRDPAAAVPWRGRSATSRGGVLLDHGTHLLYLLLDLGGQPQSVQAWTGRLRHRGYDVEDTAQVVVDFGDRAGMLFLTWAGSRRENRILLVGDRGEIEWRDGELRLEAQGRSERLDFSAALNKRAYAEWFGALFRDFLLAVETRDGVAHFEDLFRVASVLSLAYQSAEDGRRRPLASA
jgi:predicted dehydrogenase